MRCLQLFGPEHGAKCYEVEDGCTFDKFCGRPVYLFALGSVNISNICYHEVAVYITGHEFNLFSLTFVGH